jgi:D-alanyl-D-alanine carboxypeptidase/D-alanyl-D-alanine-endopeptidase (penicillin-binding protein 4)
MLARLLQSAWASPVMPEQVASLPVTGLDGTRRRSNAPPGRAHLKSGSLRDEVRAALDDLVRWTALDLKPERR